MLNVLMGCTALIAAIGLIWSVVYNSKSARASQSLAQLLQLELDYDDLQINESRICEEMGVYELSVSNDVRKSYLSLLRTNNYAMIDNVKQRGLLLEETFQWVKAENLRAIYNRSKTKHRRDDSHCHIMHTYVQKQSLKPRTHFQGLKALKGQFRALDKEYRVAEQ